MLMMPYATLQMTRSRAAARNQCCTPRLNPLQNLGALHQAGSWFLCQRMQRPVTENGSSLSAV
jgi:hypothetical protein